MNFQTGLKLRFKMAFKRDIDTILVTGASGKLGSSIVSSGLFKNILSPSREELDITDSNSVNKYIESYDFDAVIHCAALARVKMCEKEPQKARSTNVYGTGHLVDAITKKEAQLHTAIRFVHISTDGVYASRHGGYSEDSPTIPYNVYGWTKLAGECLVHTLKNYCILRTRFFDPENIKFDESAIDSFTCSLPVKDLVVCIQDLLCSDFIGTINVGGSRASDYEKFRVYKKDLRPCQLDDILKTLDFDISRDASMNLTCWENFKSKKVCVK